MKRFFKPIEKNGKPASTTSEVVAEKNVVASIKIPVEKTHSDSDSNGSTLGLEPKKKKYLQKYKSEWENKYLWLKNVKGEAFCKVCNTKMVNNLAHIKRHDISSQKHQENLKISKEMRQLDVSFMGQQSLKKKQVEMMCVLYCIQHGLPFRLMDSLPQLIQTISPTSLQAQQIKCGRTKSTAYTNTIIGPFAAEKICKILRAHSFSIIIDETTDLTSDKCLVLICRYFDQNLRKVIDVFFGMIKLKNSTASDIFLAIKEHFFKFNVDLEKNLIGLATDNASVMAGNFHGVKAKFQDMKSDIFFLGCTSHSIALCVNYALKHFPESIEKNIKNIYNHFSNSPKRLNDFSIFQADFNLANHKILRLCKTRWLSLEAVVIRILEQWEALKYYFTLYCYEIKDKGKDDNANEILEFLSADNLRLYLVFLSSILNRVNAVNKMFQSEKPEIHNLYSTIKGIYLEILKNFIILDKVDINVDIKNINNHLPIQLMYFSLNFQEMEEKFSEEDKPKILVTKHNLILFYIEFCCQIQKRFNLENSKLEILKYCNVAQIVSGSMPSIRQLMLNYPFQNEGISNETLNDQWRSLIGNKPVLNQLNSSDTVKNWVQIKNIQDNFEQFMYSELADYILILLSLPHSSAAAERAFSALNLIKNKKTNRLENETIQNIMFCKTLFKDLSESDSTDNIYVPEEELCKFAAKYKFKDGSFESI